MSPTFEVASNFVIEGHGTKPMGVAASVGTRGTEAQAVGQLTASRTA
jgi:hypothetical protein